jgi:hypothetical protein
MPQRIRCCRLLGRVGNLDYLIVASAERVAGSTPARRFCPAPLRSGEFFRRKGEVMNATDRITMDQFVAKHRITAEVGYADSNPNMADSENMYHFKITLKRKGKRLTTYFSQGYGISTEPSAEDLLNCLGSDSAGIENAASFEDWASEYGYDTDSRKAERTFKVCERQAAKLKAFLGEDAYKELLWETEQL